jgi:hypothetical protein
MEMLKKTKDLLASLVDVTEAGSKIARYKIEVANLDRKLGLAFKQIGERIYQMNKEDTLEVTSDPEITAALKDVAKLRTRMGTIHQEVGTARDKAVSEWDKASRVMKKEATRASKAVKDEATRARKAVKDEAGRASKAVKKEAGRAAGGHQEGGSEKGRPEESGSEKGRPKEGGSEKGRPEESCPEENGGEEGSSEEEGCHEESCPEENGGEEGSSEEEGTLKERVESERIGGCPATGRRSGQSRRYSATPSS